jgi:hypothetical protein
VVTIAVFQSDFDASVAKGALEAVGIPAFVPGAALGMLSRNRGGVPEGTLQVFASDKDAAVAELRRHDFHIVSRP